MPSSAQARFNETLSRADDLLREKLRREQEELERQDAADRIEDRVRARENVERRRLIAARYDDAFASFNVQTPQAMDDEAPGAYRRRLYGRLMRRLPDSHELQGIRADDLPTGKAFDNFEAMLLEAAKAEGLRPSTDNLPPSGEFLQRVRIDEATGEKSVNFYGRESFIRQMARPGQLVERFVDQRTGNVIWGAPFPSARR
jgi:hypothetical protein